MIDNNEVVKQKENLNSRELFKKCPKCGKRFDVKHIAEKVEEKKELIPEEKTYLEPAGVAVAYPIPPPRPKEIAPKVEVEEVVDEKIYVETYTCTHCGYTWTETREKSKDLGPLDKNSDV